MLGMMTSSNFISIHPTSLGINPRPVKYNLPENKIKEACTLSLPLVGLQTGVVCRSVPPASLRTPGTHPRCSPVTPSTQYASIVGRTWQREPGVLQILTDPESETLISDAFDW